MRTQLIEGRALWFGLLPACMLAAGLWVFTNRLESEAAGSLARAEALRGQLRANGAEGDAPAIERAAALHAAEAEELRDITAASTTLQNDPLVRDHEGVPFQLIDFERERVAAASLVRDGAKASGTRVSDSAFDVLADTTPTVSNPRHRWAQLALAKTAALRAVRAKVATYEARTVPAVREFREGSDRPALAEQVLFSVRVTGSSAAVQEFVELLALGEQPTEPRVFLEHLVLRKEGVEAPDLVEATIVFGSLLRPATTSSAEVVR